ncbi:hypothetical protein [Cytobacillus praedii]|uniref:hypothetical protein n=1 Tax=Cytobacillus praedii TaxID=1742358 RepID=UPI002E23427E|nr:hypothetical protein [Cytobacillus praedii]
MENIQLGTEIGFVIGHVKGEDTILIHDNPEQIIAFMMKYRMQDVTITDTFDQLLIQTSMGILMYCSNQRYLATYLQPVLVPMQRGQVNIPMFEPYVINVEVIKKLIKNPTLEQAKISQMRLEDYKYATEVHRIKPVIIELKKGEKAEAVKLLNTLLEDIKSGKLSENNNGIKEMK